jgi:SAM-dependent methyltransferase
MLPTDLLAFVRAALPDPPARVLEVGAGEGELATTLRQIGYDVLAIDPAGAHQGVVAIALHEVGDPPASFDAAVAVLSLHHVEPLTESCARLGELVRPGGRLVVDEFDVARFDDVAADWWLGQRRLLGGDEHSHPAAMVSELRAHLHPVARLRDELSAWFALGEAVPGPYLHRWSLAPELRTLEERLIAGGELPATGARFVAARL